MLGAGLGKRNINVLISEGVETFLFSKAWKLSLEPYSQWRLKFRRGKLGSEMRLTTHLHIMKKLCQSPVCLHIVMIKHRDNFNLDIYNLQIQNMRNIATFKTF
jgi:hypothetical protein